MIRIYNVFEQIITKINLFENNFLKKSGGSMSGTLDMNGQKITNLPAPTSAGDAVRKDYADKMLPKAGGTMTGSIHMGGKYVTDLATPGSPKDAANKEYVDGFLHKSGGTMTGPIAMGSKKITGLAAPTTNNDAANKKYVDDRAKDYVVEQGTSGIWTWRKWNSGVAECFGMLTITNLAMDTAFGSGGLFYGTTAIQVYPFVFIELPSLSVTYGKKTGFISFASLATNGQKGNAPGIRILSNAKDPQNGEAYYYAIGKWK